MMLTMKYKGSTKISSFIISFSDYVFHKYEEMINEFLLHCPLEAIRSATFSKVTIGINDVILVDRDCLDYSTSSRISLSKWKDFTRICYCHNLRGLTLTAHCLYIFS